MDPIASPQTTTTYSFVATSGIAGCLATGKVTIFVSPRVDPWIKEPVLNFCQGFAADSLTSDIIDGQNLTWYTSYYDTIGSSATPVPATEQLGVYYYFVSQSINNCRSGAAPIIANVVPCCEGVIFIPTSFSPNRDGLNDYFTVIRPPHMALDEMKVFDRWGNMVFSGGGSNDKWDGTYQGKPCELGTYYYMMSMTCSDGDKGIVKWQKGDVILVR